MKNILIIAFILIGASGQAQEAHRKTSSSEVKVGKEKVTIRIDSATDEDYGRAFIIIQSSSEPSPELKAWLINIPGQLWKKYNIVPYISIQIGIPGSGQCGGPGQKPCLGG